MPAKTLVLLSFIACTFYCHCQDTEIFKPDSGRKEIDAVQIRTSLRIDGLMNETEWKLAKPTGRKREKRINRNFNDFCQQ